MDRRNILITGGSAGIGRALVELYHAQGWRVITCARSVDALAALEQQFPGVMTVPCDLADSQERRALLKHVRQEVSSLAGLINNAGVQARYAYNAGDKRLSDVETEVAINLIAPVDLGHLCAPLLVGHDAFIANISSGLAYIPKGRSPLYAGTKAGLSHYTKSIRYQRPKLRFVEVVMPLVDTRLTAGRGSGKITAMEAAQQTKAGIESGRTTVWVGKSRFIPVLNRLFPSLLARMMNADDAAD